MKNLTQRRGDAEKNRVSRVTVKAAPTGGFHVSAVSDNPSWPLAAPGSGGAGFGGLRYRLSTLRPAGRSHGPAVVVVVVVVIVVGLFDYDNDNDNDSVPGIPVTTSVLIAPAGRRGQKIDPLCDGVQPGAAGRHTLGESP